MNIENSIDTFKIEGNYLNVVKGYTSSRLDNCTDALMLNELYYSNDNQSAFEKAIMVYKFKINSDSVNTLLNVINQKESLEIEECYRYWHGYLIILRLLFTFFNYSQIRMLNALIQGILVCFLVFFMIKRNLKNYIVSFFISYFFINPIAISLSLQFSTIFYITIISTIIILMFKEYILANNYFSYIILIIGMLTSYFDYLTYPIATLGIPLIFYLLIDKSDDVLSRKVKIIFVNSLIWGIGYAGMWCTKWLLSSIIQSNNLVENVLNRLMYRTSLDSMNNRGEAIIVNLSVYKDKVYKIIYMCLILYYFIKLLKVVKKGNIIARIKSAFPFLIVAIMPLVWYYFAANHSYIHAFFTSKALIVFFFGLITSAEVFTQKTEESVNKES